MSWPVGVYKINNNAVDIDFVGCKHGVMMENDYFIFNFFTSLFENDRRSGEFQKQAWEAILISTISPQGRDLIGSHFTISKGPHWPANQLLYYHHHQQGRTPKVINTTKQNSV